jgi:hypothetical protein
MSKKSSGGISLSTIIFIGFLIYTFFGDDEEKDIKDPPKTEQVEVTTEKQQTIEERVKNIAEKGVSFVEEKVKSLEAKKEKTIDEDNTIKEKEEKVVEKEKKVETFRPLEKEKPKNGIGMKKL